MVKSVIHTMAAHFFNTNSYLRLILSYIQMLWDRMFFPQYGRLIGVMVTGLVDGWI